MSLIRSVKPDKYYAVCRKCESKVVGSKNLRTEEMYFYCRKCRVFETIGTCEWNKFFKNYKHEGRK